MQPKSVLLLASLLLSNSTAFATNATNTNLTVALIRTPPPNWPLPVLNKNWTGIELNISQTVDAAIDLIQGAAHDGADVVTFPELWFPGYPTGNDQNNWTVDYLPMYINNSLVLGSPDFNRLIEGIKEANIYTALAFSELSANRLFMAQMLVSPTGDILVHRHKLRPSGSERWFFSDGTVDELQVVTTGGKLGRVGLLECFEHFYPTMTFAMQAQKESTHFAAFPYLASSTNPDALWWESSIAAAAATRHYTILSGAYTFLTSVGYAVVFDPEGNTVAEIDADADILEKPILWASVPTDGFNISKQWNVDGQASWGALRQMKDAFPEWIPKVEGKLVPEHEVDVEWLMQGKLTTEVGMEIDLELGG